MRGRSASASTAAAAAAAAAGAARWCCWRRTRRRAPTLVNVDADGAAHQGSPAKRRRWVQLRGVCGRADAAGCGHAAAAAASTGPLVVAAAAPTPLGSVRERAIR